MNGYRLERDEKGMRVKTTHVTPLFVLTEKTDYEVQLFASDETIVVTLTTDVFCHKL